MQWLLDDWTVCCCGGALAIWAYCLAPPVIVGCLFFLQKRTQFCLSIAPDLASIPLLLAEIDLFVLLNISQSLYVYCLYGSTHHWSHRATGQSMLRVIAKVNSDNLVTELWGRLEIRHCQYLFSSIHNKTGDSWEIFYIIVTYWYTTNFDLFIEWYDLTNF